MKTWVLLVGVFALVAALSAPVRAEDDVVVEDAAAEAVVEDVAETTGNAATAGLDMENAEAFEFQAEVNRMMKLIINSLYKNKDIYLRELISNASDALDKIRFLSVTDSSVLGDVTDLHIKIHVDKENGILHITDTGIGMTKQDLINNLGTIAKSGTSDFLTAVAEGQADAGSLIGQFGVGFYSAFLVADTVVVTSKHNDDVQHVWTSDASSFSIVEDTREEEQLGRGTRISLHLKEEAKEFLEENKIRELIKKYSEFISFDIYLYTSKVVDIDPAELEAEAEAMEVDAEEEGDEEDAEGDDEEGDEDGAVEEEDDEEDTTPVETTRTVWDWEVINANKPIWTRNAKDVEKEEYVKFFQAFTKEDGKEPLGHIHFTAEGEVTFRAILYIPETAPNGFYNDYGGQRSNLKMYVRRVFITDEFEDMMPKYLGFLKGVVDSDDLPLNVSRETLQQHKLLKVIKKKLVRKALDMIKKLDKETYQKFWKEFGTSIKLGLIEDYSNRTRLAKLLRFMSSYDKTEYVSLEEYVERMKSNQETIFFMAAASRTEAESSPFVERLLKRGYEVLYLVEPVDEYALQNLPEFDGKKFQNVAKEGLTLDDSEAAKELLEQQQQEFEPLTKYLADVLGDSIEKAVVSDRLTDSPCALVATQYGWSGNMERIMRAQAYAKADDASSNFYANQKKVLELNPRHPLIKNMLERAASVAAAEEAEEDTTDSLLEDTARVLLDTARLRSGYMMDNSVEFAQRIERMLRVSTGVDLDAQVEPEPELFVDDDEEEGDDEEEEVEADDEEDAEEDEEGEEGEEDEVDEEADEEAGHDEL
eukprot:m.352067 g.352067  ORF g.352067 m.352067 type:complete len:818 (-) comp16431_c0_seq1:134-2587(-)